MGLSKFATAATVLPSGEIDQSITPLAGFEMSVTNLPLPQSLASGENGFLGAQRTLLSTLKSGSFRHCGDGRSLLTWSRHRSWSLWLPSGDLSRNIAITFCSTVGAHERSLNLSPGCVTATAVESGFDMSLTNTRRLPT